MIIPGGTDFLSRRFDDFEVGDKHSVFAWCKIYVDQNPNATWPVLLGATAWARERRLTMLGAQGSNVPGIRIEPDVNVDGTEDESNEAVRIVLPLWDDKTLYRTQNKLYQELAEGIRARRIEYDPVFLDDCQEKLDETLCVISKDAVLDIAERVGGYGTAINEMLAEREQQEDAPPASTEPEEAAIIPTGMPGRPGKGKHFIEDEFNRREAARTACGELLNLADEAKSLLEWLKRSHPKAARPTLKTIMNNLRSLAPGRWTRRARN